MGSYPCPRPPVNNGGSEAWLPALQGGLPWCSCWLAWLEDFGGLPSLPASLPPSIQCRLLTTKRDKRPERQDANPHRITHLRRRFPTTKEREHEHHQHLAGEDDATTGRPSGLTASRPPPCRPSPLPLPAMTPHLPTPPEDKGGKGLRK